MNMNTIHTQARQLVEALANIELDAKAFDRQLAESGTDDAIVAHGRWVYDLAVTVAQFSDTVLPYLHVRDTEVIEDEDV